MRLYLVLSAAVAVLSTTATSSGAINPATNLVENKDHGIRLLRSEAIDADDEERANMVLGGLIRDSKVTKETLSSWVKSGDTIETVGARLGLQQGLSLEKKAEHMNYEALAKFIRMKFEAENAGKQLPYAKFGTGLQNKEKTKNFLDGELIAGSSVENVGKYLGVWGLPLNQQRIHPNWRAFKRYSKMYAEYQKLMKPIRFSYIGSGYQTEEKTKDIMLNWAMAKSRVADVKQSLGLTGLSGQQLTEHVNYEALQLFKGYVNDVKRLEETVAAGRGHPLPLPPAPGAGRAQPLPLPPGPGAGRAQPLPLPPGPRAS